MSNPEDQDLTPDDVLEEISHPDSDPDIPMDSDPDSDQEHDEQEELITLQNDSIAHFDHHKDSIFVIAQHPLYPSLIATGGSEGDDENAPGKAYIFDTSPARGRPLLPASYASDPDAPTEGVSLGELFAIDGHTDSITALAFTLPKGQFLISGGMDGRVQAHGVGIKPGEAARFKLFGEAVEDLEVNWIIPCPYAEQPNSFALGASDGSVWVYVVDLSDKASPLRIIQSYFLHTAPCTAGAWTPDGTLLATVSEDSSFYVWDVWGLAAAQGIVGSNGMTVVSFTGADQRFEVEGGLYSVAIEPKGTYAALGGVAGAIKIVSLPRLSTSQEPPRGSKGKASDPTPGGHILASLALQTETVETLAFSTPTTNPQQPTLLAAGSADGSIAVFDTSKKFAVRRHVVGAHDEHVVVKVEFVKGSWMLTSCGMDGVVRRWDLRQGGQSAGAASSTSAPEAAGLVKEWRGHRGDGAGGGVMGFVQGETGERIVTAGDDGVVLVFEM